ncbi:metal-sulfur cluster assembly factor [Rhodopila sp.]|uniref:metal-sulfur cluster assembly factor n=1 Tax=Rhodopila sp. TaxID=2480087 RepID=UPI003D0AA3BA
MSVANANDRAQQVWARLSMVTDPELDESVTELGFVSQVQTDPAGNVAISFRLPTYWCAANFAFMMTEDLRRAALSLPWVRNVSLTIDDHMYADEINRGMADGLSFQQAFPTEASADLSRVRRSFGIKAFQRRQEAVLRDLLDAGQTPQSLTEMTISMLRSLGGQLAERYLEKRDLAGPASDADAAFVDADGHRIDPLRLAEYLRDLRRVTINVEFNGALCRGLLAARYKDAPRDTSQPELLHFIRDYQQPGRG